MSTLKVNKIRDTSGSADAIVLDPNGGAKIAGVCTATTFSGAFSGDAASLTQIPAANLVGVCTSGLTRTGGFGKFASYAIIADVKANATNGGTFTAGAWQTRDLNTEISDADGIVSISSNQFTLAAGSYLIKARCPAFNTNVHQSRLYNVSDTNVEQVGSAAFVNGSSGHVVTDSVCLARVTISGSKTFEIQHYAAVTSATYGFGVSGASGNSMIYTTVEIYKEA